MRTELPIDEDSYSHQIAAQAVSRLASIVYAENVSRWKAIASRSDDARTILDVVLEPSGEVRCESPKETA